MQSGHTVLWTSPVVQMVKNLRAVQKTWVQSLGQEYHLEKGQATHSCMLAWRFLQRQEPGEEGLQSMGLQELNMTQ